MTQNDFDDFALPDIDDDLMVSSSEQQSNGVEAVNTANHQSSNKVPLDRNVERLNAPKRPPSASLRKPPPRKGVAPKRRVRKADESFLPKERINTGVENEILKTPVSLEPKDSIVDDIAAIGNNEDWDSIEDLRFLEDFELEDDAAIPSLPEFNLGEDDALTTTQTDATETNDGGWDNLDFNFDEDAIAPEVKNEKYENWLEDEDGENFSFEEIGEDSLEEDSFSQLPKESSISSDEAAFLDVENLSDEEFERLIEEEEAKNRLYDEFEENEDDNLLEEETNEIEDLNEDEEEIKEEKPKDKPKKKSSKPNPKGVLGFLLSLLSIYRKFSNLVWGSVSSILSVLSKLPVVGRIFLLTNQVLKVTPDFLKDFALPAVPVLAVSLGVFAMPGSSQALELPDSGGAKTSEIVYDNQTITANVENTGDIIAHTLPEFIVKKVNLANPLTWFNPQEVGKCMGEEISVPIGESISIAANCDFEHPGGVVKVDSILL